MCGTIDCAQQIDSVFAICPVMFARVACYGASELLSVKALDLVRDQEERRTFALVWEKS